MPNLNPACPLAGDRGRPRFYFGRFTEDDIWCGEAQLIDDINLQRAAMCGPVFLSRLYQGLGAPVEQVHAAMEAGEYEKVPDPSLELQEGQYRVVPEDDSRIEVYLRRSHYGWSMIGLNQECDKLLCLASRGYPGKRLGHVLESAAGKMVVAGAYDALLMDEGDDVFQIAALGGPGAAARVAGGAAPLDMTVPLLADEIRRTRLRATFIFARRK